MATNCSAESLPICCKGGGGILVYPFGGYEETEPVVMSLVYMVLLLWLFMGVAMAADAFMTAIEQITSTLKYVKHVTKDGSIKRFRVRTWNPTVANLTLMALGSSAPEILLSTLELIFEDSKGLYQGALGPSTIVGSASFNLFVIIAVCVVAIPADEVRTIMQPRVYTITAFFSVFAYVWMAIVLMMSSPDMIEVWEAIVTLLLFPLVVWLAFLADKSLDPRFVAKWSKRFGMKSSKETASTLLPSEMLLEVKRPDGTPLDGAELAGMIKRLRRTTTGLAVDEEKAVTEVYKQMASQQPRSRAYYRVNATRSITSGQQVSAERALPASAASGALRAKVAAEEPQLELTPELKPGQSQCEFAAPSYAVIEAAGTVTVQVLRVGDTSEDVSISYKTIDGSAQAGSDFEGHDGTIAFAAGQSTCDITVKIFDDDEIEPDEVFSIELTKVVSGNATLGAMRETRVTIINDDFPGTFTLPKEEISVKENEGMCKVQVDRVQGCSGEVSLQYKTVDGKALAGKNYTQCEGTLTWKHQEVDPKFIEIPITDDDVMLGNLFFELELHSATGGAVFDEKTDGSKEKSMARITIVDDDAVRSIAERAIGMLGMSQQGVFLGASSWGDQFRAALSPSGGDDDDDEAGAKAPVKLSTRIIHYIALPWKLLVALIPPASIAGGYPCFGVAICIIGVMTAAIGDLANLMGCSMGLKAEVVAFTFVALGTSLPDTFASKSAAQGDATADAAIGNVTGSNAVNVFLGSGVSWLLGSVFWASKGYDAYWISKYTDIARKYGHHIGPDGNVVMGKVVGLAVPSGTLGVSVITFCVCAIVCIFTLALRRKFFGGELGSKLRWPTFALFIGLWLIYVTVSAVVAYSTETKD